MPRLLNLFIDPHVIRRRDEALSDKSGSAGLQPAPTREMDIHVAGLACTGICVRRTQQGLETLPGVQDVRFKPDEDTFTVRYHGDVLEHDRVEKAVRQQVVAKPVRKLLDWIGRPCRRAVP